MGVEAAGRAGGGGWGGGVGGGGGGRGVTPARRRPPLLSLSPPRGPAPARRPLSLCLTLGRKVLKPRISSRSPWNRSFTRWMTPSVLMLEWRSGGAGRGEGERVRVGASAKKESRRAREGPKKKKAGGGAPRPQPPHHPGPRPHEGRPLDLPSPHTEHPKQHKNALLGFKLLHDRQEGVVDALVVGEPLLDLPQVGQGVVRGQAAGCGRGGGPAGGECVCVCVCVWRV